MPSNLPFNATRNRSNQHAVWLRYLRAIRLLVAALAGLIGAITALIVVLAGK
jgi:hypothetical protein